MDDLAEVIERREGYSGELVLRRRGGEYQVICGGSFLIADSNEHSSRAMVSAAVPLLPERPLDVLIGGLGMGYALDEALDLPGLRRVTVAELEPVIVEWFARFFVAQASRAARDARATIVIADVLDVLRASARDYDLIALDTDNGPDWLVRDENRRLYDDDGLRLVATALRPGGVAVFWTTGRVTAFERALRARFTAVTPVTVHDAVDGRRFDYTMEVCRGGGGPAAGAPDRDEERAAQPAARRLLGCEHGVDSGLPAERAKEAT